MIEIFVDADACPVKDEVYKVAGRYELQVVNRWVEGYYQQVWVPEVCKEKNRRHSRVTKCTGGFHEQQWVPGRYEQVQEWVWVTHGRDDGWRSNGTHPATYHP